MHMYVSLKFLSHISFESSSQCSTISPCGLSTLYIVICIVNPNFLIYSSPHLSLLVTKSFVFLSLLVSFCFVGKFICIIF